MREVVTKIPYKPHSGQAPMHRSRARIRVLDCGRRFGKDRFTLQEAARMAFKMAAEPRPRSLIPKVHVWSVAPTFPMLRQTWAELKAFWEPTGLIKRKDEAELTLEFFNGVFWELKSANKPEDLVSVGLDVLTFTEAARAKESAWQENLRPTLSSPLRGPRMAGKGVAIFNSTPKGRNWFYRLWLRGRKTIVRAGREIPNPDYDPDYESWQLPTAANPFISRDEVEAARRELPHAVYAQEYLAEFLDDAAGVFINIDDCASGDFAPPEPGRQYAVGVDLAYKVDFTVITVMDAETRHVVHQERFQSTLWADQEPRIVWCAKTYNNAPILVDCTGVGYTGPEMLRRALGAGHRVDGFFFTQDSKEELVTALQMAFQTKAISYPDAPEMATLREELLSYEYTYTKTGRFRYSAPPGQHDDCVMSLALALRACSLAPYEVYDVAY